MFLLKLLPIFVFGILHLHSAESQSQKVEAKIIGGTFTTINKYPYLVQLLRDGQFIGAGALISTTLVCTAAHAVAGYTVMHFEILAGSTYMAEGGVRRKIQAIARPTTYDPINFNMDIAIMKLVSPVSGTNIGTISIGMSGVPLGIFVTVAGWGTTEFGFPSYQLMDVSVQTITKPECKKYLNVSSTAFCAYTPNKDSCFGDSGGPAVYNNKIVGIVSFGKGCGQVPGAYTSTTAAKNFIEKAIKRLS